MKDHKSAGGGENHEHKRKSNEFSTSTSNRNMSVKKKKSFQRLGGSPGGLSLEAFANAKTKNNNYNPAIIKKKREFYKNAKRVNKYKKTLKQLSQQNNDQGGQSKDIPSSSVLSPQGNNEEQYESGNMNKRNNVNNRDNVYKRNNMNKRESKVRNYNKGSNSLEEIYARKREEKEKERMEREAIIKAKKDEREKAEARRRDTKVKMLKKTRKGQPVMKYRIEHLLETLRSSES